MFSLTVLNCISSLFYSVMIYGCCQEKLQFLVSKLIDIHCNYVKYDF